MRIAVEGCAHGELEKIYGALTEMEKINGEKIDLLICCGDFQSTRNLTDLNCMAVPDKYKDMCSFYKYYSGEKTAPVLTIFIGGNHEASNYLQELSYGGWVAPNIYYLGYAGVVTVAGIRIAGISGIYKSQHYLQGHNECPPYTDRSLKSVYHIRNLEVFRLKQLSEKIDIFLSHDWPNGVTKHGDEQYLLQKKPFFRDDIMNKALGSSPAMELLEHHYPTYWFSAHLHCKFAAVVPDKNSTKFTKFLALDKCLPRRNYLQVINIDHDTNEPIKLCYDLEWLTILNLTNHLLSIKSGNHYMPGPGYDSRWNFIPTDNEKDIVFKKFNGNLEIPLNFEQTVKPYDPNDNASYAEIPRININKQTTQFCVTLGIDDPMDLLQLITGSKETKKESTDILTFVNKESESGFKSDDSSDIPDDIIEDNVNDLPLVDDSMKECENSESNNMKRVTELVNEEESPNKRFKRRNQSIYMDE